MAVIVKTDGPSGLLKAIKDGIDKGSIETWSYDQQGDFTHTPDQWKNRAWLRPQLYQGELRFGILKQQGVDMSTVVYGVYHGRFIEMLLSHFDKSFLSASGTAAKTTPDNF